MAVLFVIVVLVFPVIFGPKVELPAGLPFGDPFSVAVQISNQNVTPLTEVEFSCEVSKLTLANGSAVGDAKVLIRGTIRELPARQAATMHCATAYIVNAPLQAAEYKLALTYRMYPWPQHRSSVYRIAAQINGSGQITGWSLH